MLLNMVLLLLIIVNILFLSNHKIVAYHITSSYTKLKHNHHINDRFDRAISKHHLKKHQNDMILLDISNSNHQQQSQQLPQPSDSFIFLKSLDERCERLSKLESEFLLSFWSDNLQCFQIFPNTNSTRISITSSCIALMAILANPSHWKNYAIWESNINNNIDINNKISLKNVIHSIQNESWRIDDTFQIQLLLSTLCMFSDYNKNNEKFKKSIDLLLIRRSKYLLHRDQLISSYLRHQNVVALLSLIENNGVSTDNPETIAQFVFALERSNMVAFDELCRQLAFYNCGDSANFDVIILTYSVLSYWDTANSLFISSYSKGVVPRVNIKLVQSALTVIFSSQSQDGTWIKGEPINKLVGSAGRDIGNNYVFFFDLVASLLGSIGEAQPELLAPYLTQLERCITWAESNILQEVLPEYIGSQSGKKVRKTVKGWRSNHLGTTGGAVGWCTAQVFLGLSRIRKLLRRLITMNILNEFRGVSAPSSQLFRGEKTNKRDWENLMDADLELSGIKTTLKKELLSRLLIPLEMKESLEIYSLRGKSYHQLETTSTITAVITNSTGTSWYIDNKEVSKKKEELEFQLDNEYDLPLLSSSLSLSTSDTSCSSSSSSNSNSNSSNNKQEVLNNDSNNEVLSMDLSSSTTNTPSVQVVPIILNGNNNNNNDLLDNNQMPVYSLILFGPPGTAKTTICTSIANYLNWNFLTIDTACFLADGLENIASRMSYIFSRLTVLERTIILFDEIEEFCLDRENPSLGMESRMLTTAMLTQLNDLRRKQLSVFIVATNRLRSFDTAVTRPGRFDMLVFVGTPNLKARLKRMKNKLSNTGIANQHDLLEHVTTYMSNHWSEFRFLTFAENEVFLANILNLALREELSESRMHERLMTLLRTSIIQGAVKEEYIASEVLSRA